MLINSCSVQIISGGVGWRSFWKRSKGCWLSWFLLGCPLFSFPHFSSVLRHPVSPTPTSPRVSYIYFTVFHGSLLPLSSSFLVFPPSSPLFICLCLIPNLGERIICTQIVLNYFKILLRPWASVLVAQVCDVFNGV